jgi:predicted small secreted protein
MGTMKKLLPVALSLLLSGCATYGPGEDAYGRTLQGTGEDVLQAARNYIDETTRVPKTLNELVPKYLSALPKEPDIQYDRQNSTLFFTYMQKGPNGMAVTCHALLGQLQWVCA